MLFLPGLDLLLRSGQALGVDKHESSRLAVELGEKGVQRLDLSRRTDGMRPGQHLAGLSPDQKMCHLF